MEGRSVPPGYLDFGVGAQGASRNACATRTERAGKRSRVGACPPIDTRVRSGLRIRTPPSALPAAFRAMGRTGLEPLTSGNCRDALVTILGRSVLRKGP